MKGTFFLGTEATPKFEVRPMEFLPLGPHEVMIKNKACGVCGTDVHIYHGEEGSAEVKPPVVLGHEYAGIVTATGEAVDNVKVGDKVAVDPNMYCGKCLPCRMGKKQNCENLFALGVNVNGGFAQYSVCPDTQCFRMKDSVSFEEAAMAEPLACAVHGIDRAGIRPGQSVLIIGGGTIGLLMVQLARLSGASSVMVSEPIAMRRKIALEVGADAAIDPLSVDLKEEIRKISGRDGADVVIECIGKAATSEQALDVAGFGATVLLFGVPHIDAKAALPMFKVYQKELTVTGSMINPDTHQRAVNLINGGRLELKKLITHVYDIDRLEEAIQMQMSSESIKVMVCPGEQEI